MAAVRDLLRKQSPFADTVSLMAATGSRFRRPIAFFPCQQRGAHQRVSPGLPQAYEYNACFLPAGSYAPWWIHEIRLSPSFAVSARQTKDGLQRNDAAALADSTATPFPTLAGPSLSPQSCQRYAVAAQLSLKSRAEVAPRPGLPRAAFADIAIST